MSSWVYIFSKFTPEALLLEALFIFVLFSGYTLFWVLKKRKFGVVETALPAGPVQSYLNELIGNAEQLRSQLFGLLSSHDVDPQQFLARSALLQAQLGGAGPTINLGPPTTSSASLPAGGDPEFAKKVEAKMAEQAKAMEAIVAEKGKLEKELADVKNSSAAAMAAGGGDAAQNAAMIADLKKKVADLESKLAEYNVIEDDLANLKRLQQENAQLKAALASAGATAPAAAASAAATPAPAPAAAPAVAAPAQAAAAALEAAAIPTAEEAAAEEASLDSLLEQAGAAAAEAAPAAAEAPAAPEAAAADPFANLAGQVDESLQADTSGPASGATAEPVAESAAPASSDAAPSTTDPAAATTGGTDADLVAEFEKMLKG